MVSFPLTVCKIKELLFDISKINTTDLTFMVQIT